jgi:hypothetical protein
MQSPLRSREASPVSADGGTRDAERAKLGELIVIMPAESTVPMARSAELAEIQRTAYRRYSAAKGHVTRARHTGDTARIVAAEAAERAAYEEADRIIGPRLDVDVPVAAPQGRGGGRGKHGLAKGLLVLGAGLRSRDITPEDLPAYRSPGERGTT